MYRKLTIDEVETLKLLYVKQNIPTDQYKRRQQALRVLTDKFNTLAERSDEPDDVLHFMISQRKQGKWPKLGTGHKKLASVSEDVLTPDEWKLLEDVYLDINKGSDNYAYDTSLRRELTRRFSREARRYVDPRTLAAALEKRRKDGSLPTVTDRPPEPFADMDSVAM